MPPRELTRGWCLQSRMSETLRAHQGMCRVSKGGRLDNSRGPDRTKGLGTGGRNRAVACLAWAGSDEPDMAGRFLLAVPCALSLAALCLPPAACSACCALFLKKPLLGCQNGRNVVALKTWRPTSQLCRVLWETIVGNSPVPVSVGPSAVCLIFPGPGTHKEGRGITAEAGGSRPPASG
jgi:hypothetical protein